MMKHEWGVGPPELDVEVAEKVMGWAHVGWWSIHPWPPDMPSPPPPGVRKLNLSGTEVLLPDDLGAMPIREGIPPGQNKFEALPEYAEKMVDAWKVVEKMRQSRHFGKFVRNLPGANNGIHGLMMILGPKGICCAALDAVKELSSGD